MIVFEDVSKIYHIQHYRKQVFRDVNLTIERGESIGICGANGAGKSTLMRLISGVEQPTSGKIFRNMSTSWPIGYASCFQSSLTGADNSRFIARIYKQDERELLDYVDDFAQLGPYLHQPINTYSSGMIARLAFGLSLAISFDCYLIDEVTSAGDARFRARSDEALAMRRDTSTIVMISHDPSTLQRYCKRGAVLYGGCLAFYDTIDEACDVHHRLQMRGA